MISRHTPTSIWAVSILCLSVVQSADLSCFDGMVVLVNWLILCSLLNLIGDS